MPRRFALIFHGRTAVESERRRQAHRPACELLLMRGMSANEIREMLQYTRLIRFYKKTYRLTKRGERFLDPERRGELLTLLFRAFFKPEPDYAFSEHWLTPMELSLGYMLYRWSRLDRKWREPWDRLTDIVPYYTRGRMLSQLGREGASEALEGLFMLKLEQFGLAESGRRPGPESETSPTRYRPTPLARKFLLFPDLP